MAMAFFSEQSEPHLSWRKLQQIMDVPWETTASPLDHPQHLHPTSSHSIQCALGLPLQQEEGDNCLRVTCGRQHGITIVVQ